MVDLGVFLVIILPHVVGNDHLNDFWHIMRGVLMNGHIYHAVSILIMKFGFKTVDPIANFATNFS